MLFDVTHIYAGVFKGVNQRFSKGVQWHTGVPRVPLVVPRNLVCYLIGV